ncbi:hypothetical protein LY78DRAFT_154704 [Colletotrichum sublineola]|nr:hypothetical protein LY78DRAFT_154704 [Colletotrichum sublineola]
MRQRIKQTGISIIAPMRPYPQFAPTPCNPEAAQIREILRFRPPPPPFIRTVHTDERAKPGWGCNVCMLSTWPISLILSLSVSLPSLKPRTSFRPMLRIQCTQNNNKKGRHNAHFDDVGTSNGGKKRPSQATHPPTCSFLAGRSAPTMVTDSLDPFPDQASRSLPHLSSMWRNLRHPGGKRLFAENICGLERHPILEAEPTCTSFSSP